MGVPRLSMLPREASDPGVPVLKPARKPGVCSDRQSGSRHASDVTLRETDFTQRLLISDQEILDEIFLFHVKDGSIRSNLLSIERIRGRLALLASNNSSLLSKLALSHLGHS